MLTGKHLKFLHFRGLAELSAKCEIFVQHSLRHFSTHYVSIRWPRTNMNLKRGHVSRTDNIDATIYFLIYPYTDWVVWLKHNMFETVMFRKQSNYNIDDNKHTTNWLIQSIRVFTIINFTFMWRTFYLVMENLMRIITFETTQT